MAGGDDRQDDRGSGKGGEEEPEERTDGWMTTYSDMVTLLMTFFVLMFAISNVDNQKAMLFFAGMSRDGLSATQFQEIVDMFNPGDDPGQIYIPEGGQWASTWDDEEDPEFGDEGNDEEGEGNEELQDLYNVLHNFIVIGGLSEHMNLHITGEYLLITLANEVLFDLGRAEIRPEMRYIGTRIAELISGTHNPQNPFEIVVAGHTDDWPIATAEFPSNWHLSSRRALNFLSILIEGRGDIDPAYFSSRGLGEYHPIATNETVEGRQANRRVEVMVALPRAIPRDPYLGVIEDAAVIYQGTEEDASS